MANKFQPPTANCLPPTMNSPSPSQTKHQHLHLRNTAIHHHSPWLMQPANTPPATANIRISHWLDTPPSSFSIFTFATHNIRTAVRSTTTQPHSTIDPYTFTSEHGRATPPPQTKALFTAKSFHRTLPSSSSPVTTQPPRCAREPATSCRVRDRTTQQCHTPAPPRLHHSHCSRPRHLWFGTCSQNHGFRFCSMLSWKNCILGVWIMF